MKNTALLLALCLPLMGFARHESVAFDKILQAMQRGDAMALAAHFDQRVELTLPQQEGEYSAAEARTVLQRFFTAYPPTRFVQDHQGKSPAGSNFLIGTLQTSKGSFRAFLYTRSGPGGRTIIDQLQLEAL